jgi:hypothetical protein
MPTKTIEDAARVHILFPGDLNAELRERAASEDRPLASIVRVALREYLPRQALIRSGAKIRDHE